MQSLPATITIPAQKNSHIININSDLSPAIKYADIDDIELPDGTKIGYPSDSELKRMQQAQAQAQASHHQDSSDANIAEKYSLLAAAALKNFDLTLSDATLNQTNGSLMSSSSVNDLHSMQSPDPNNTSADDDNNVGPGNYPCYNCGKNYRWKSTLRRHEKEECGDREPTHQCPYCSYKAKQRGNLGVHVRKHHSHMPELESRRKRKASMN